MNEVRTRRVEPPIACAGVQTDAAKRSINTQADTMLLEKITKDTTMHLSAES